MAGPNPLRTLLALRRHDRSSRKAIEAFQSRHLRRLVAHAYERVPYYRSLFDAAGVSPADIRGPADLQHLPVTTRATLQQLPAREIVASGIDPDGLMQSASSGSTGEPVTIRRTWIEMRLLSTIRVRGYKQIGMRPGDVPVTVKTLVRDAQSDRSAVGRVLSKLRPSSWQAVDAALPSAEIASQLTARGAKLLSGYPSHLCVIASEVDPAVLHDIGLRFVCVGGEILTPEQREQIESAFGVPLRETYGSTEFDLLAGECSKGHGYHVADDGLVLEVVEDGVPVAVGEQGEVVGTNLHSYAMPLIRYAQGDVVERGPSTCPCASAFSNIRRIRGRVVEFFRLPNGERIHPYDVFIPIRQSARWIQRFQATQLTPEHVVLRIVSDVEPSGDQLAAVQRVFAERFAPGVHLEVERVEDFAATPTGKFQIYRSHVEHPAPVTAGDD